jgi:shikimate 5-dehydrogenase
MLVAQAREQFHCWTGTMPRAEVMKDAALMRLAEFARDGNHLV